MPASLHLPPIFLPFFKMACGTWKPQAGNMASVTLHNISITKMLDSNFRQEGKKDRTVFCKEESFAFKHGHLQLVGFCLGFPSSCNLEGVRTNLPRSRSRPEGLACRKQTRPAYGLVQKDYGMSLSSSAQRVQQRTNFEPPSNADGAFCTLIFILETHPQVISHTHVGARESKLPTGGGV